MRAAAAPTGRHWCLAQGPKGCLPPAWDTEPTLPRPLCKHHTQSLRELREVCRVNGPREPGRWLKRSSNDWSWRLTTSPFSSASDSRFCRESGCSPYQPPGSKVTPFYQGRLFKQEPPRLRDHGEVPWRLPYSMCTKPRRRVSSGPLGLVLATCAQPRPRDKQGSVVCALCYFFIGTFPPNNPYFMSVHMAWVVCVCDRFA